MRKLLISVFWAKISAGVKNCVRLDKMLTFCVLINDCVPAYVVRKDTVDS